MSCGESKQTPLFADADAAEVDEVVPSTSPDTTAVCPHHESPSNTTCTEQSPEDSAQQAQAAAQAEALSTQDASCKAEIARLQAQNDSLRSVGTDKDSNISEFVTTFNEIESNLDSIKQLERVIDKSAKAGEVKGSRKEQIKSDISYIYNLLQKNRELVASLTAKLNKSNKHAAELQKMIDNLKVFIRVPCFRGMKFFQTIR